MEYRVNIGDKLPSFRVKDHEGYELHEEDLLGRPIVLYFYPKNETTTCTQEACDFRDKMKEIDGMGAIVLGVSPDSMKSHQDFLKKHKLNFTLLVDEKQEMCKAFDVVRDKGIERTTFVTDADGIIRWVERPVDIKGHVGRVMKAVEKYRDESEAEIQAFIKKLNDGAK